MTELTDLSETDADNTTITTANIAEGCPPSGINNAIRNLAGLIRRAFKASIFRLRDTTDQTKLLAFDLSGITTATTRTITMPDSDVDLATEGTFTPTLTCGSGTATLNAVSMQYTKVGRQVSVCGLMTVGSVSSPSGTLAMNGLPFTNGTGDGFIAAISIRVDNYNAGTGRVFQGYVASNQSAIVIDVYNTNTGLIEVSPAAFLKANTIIAIQATYFAA